MGLSSAIDWWDEWKLRILVLGSLFAHSFLFFSIYVRKSYALRRLRVLVWIAYIGGDALAIYALATLFNRQKQQQQTTADGGGNFSIEVLWAPFLLIHLGGHVQISAYSLEDNELWKRHAITLVSQVTVALYVFCKWWSGETSLLGAAVLLFIGGILKFSQKPWALRRASYGSMTTTTDLRDKPAQLEQKKRRGGVREKGINDFSLEEYVREAKAQVKGGRKKSDHRKSSMDIYELFLDVSAPHSVRLAYLQSFLKSDGEKQNKRLRKYIDLQFSAIYTKVRSRLTFLGLCTFLVLPSLVMASVVLFAKSDKDGYDKSDITVTYILFFSTLVIELGSFFIGLSCPSLFPRNNNLLSRTWQDMVSQHNIMSFCARKKKPPTLMKLATFSCLRDFINCHWYIWHEPASQQILELVRRHVEEDGWDKYIHDAATYRRFNNLRGQQTLMKHHLLHQDKLGWTFDRPFDEYVLLWHIATDLCLHHTSSSTNNTTTAASSQSQDTINSCRIISNYMIYLLFICPDMLIPAGTRSDLFMHACREIECMIEDKSPWSSLDKTTGAIAQWILGMEQGDQRWTEAPRIANKWILGMAKWILGMEQGDQRWTEALRIAKRILGIAKRILGMEQGDERLTLISSAHKLARVLIESLDEEKRWEVIQGVWVEMLCYSASRCRGYLHTKSLGVAPEFLTNVWLLWWCMGMQTLPEMMNNLGPHEEQTAVAAAV